MCFSQIVTSFAWDVGGGGDVDSRLVVNEDGSRVELRETNGSQEVTEAEDELAGIYVHRVVF